MRKLIGTPRGVSVSYSTYGSGPPLVLVHGAFSDDLTNWSEVRPYLEEHFTVFAIARRGRGETDATEGHRMEDEARDIGAFIAAVGEPVFLVGHSYGAQCSLVAAALDPGGIRKLVLYEPPDPATLSTEDLAGLERRAARGDWEGVATSFFTQVLGVPAGEFDELRNSALWPAIVDDARASLGDLRAIANYDFRASRFSELQLPVLLQVGSESPRELYVTDALAASLPDVRVGVLDGQAHDAMLTDPRTYAESVVGFLLRGSGG